ncbi:Xenobiotic compound monooxygenase DszA family [Penicillium canariense]|uniref:Xenobiotic compound monooxygenase DszA family n=1 Tax=Penicillium canariense TaxID=189055 RepID=A0A9W9IFA7_9EURO|nr:Xenobiotic compound monooxygenase DszA family [Penicillium canariense]KAJ5175302.1 Xenobiotic compound monooxygenase DszA family [Penicillium canariense]
MVELIFFTLFFGWTGIDLSQVPPDEDINPGKHSLGVHWVTSVIKMPTARIPDLPSLNLQLASEMASIGGLGPVATGTPAQVAGVMVAWINEADTDGFEIPYVITPVRLKMSSTCSFPSSGVADFIPRRLRPRIL